MAETGTQPTSANSNIQRQRLLRVTLLAYRNPNLTEEQFHYHWTNIHAPKVSAHLAKFGILSYKQYHCPSSLRQSFTSAIPSLSKGADSAADYDGFVELLMPSLDCYEKALQDEYYVNVVAPDDKYFADMERSKMLVGWEEVYVQDGKPVNFPQSTEQAMEESSRTENID